MAKKGFSIFGSKKKKQLGSDKKETNPVVVLSAGLIATAVIALLMVVFIIYPSVQSIIEMRNQIEQNQDLLERLETKSAALTRARREYESQPEVFARLNYGFPDDAEYMQDLKILERIAAETTSSGANFILLNLSIGALPIYREPTRTARPYNRTEMDFSVSFRADYAGTQAFLNNIKKSLRNFTIQQVVFSASRSGGSNTMLDVSSRLRNIYYAPF